MKEFAPQAGGDSNTVKKAAVLIGILDEQNCLVTSNQESNGKFVDKSPQVYSKTQVWNPNQLTGQATSVERLAMWDAAGNYYLPESWCSRNSPTETTFSLGYPQSPICTTRDDVYRSIPFTPPKVTTPVACTDAVPTWVYSVYQNAYTADTEYFKVSLDSEASLIWVKAIPGGLITEDIVYKVEIRAETPAGLTTTFELTISVTGCINTPIIPSVLVDQLYYVNFPMGDYDPAFFTIDASCGQGLYFDYINVVTTNDFIDDTYGYGKYLSWETTDNSDVGTYTVTISATNYCQTGTASYTLDVRSTCDGQLLQIDPTDSKFTSPALIQNVWQQPFGTLSWDDTNVVKAYPGFDCGPFEFELVTQLETVPDVDVFTPDSGLDPRQLDVYTEDSLKVRAYSLRIKVKLTDWPENPGATKDFTVEIADICEVGPYDVTPSVPLADVVYMAGRAAFNTAAMVPFTYVPNYCPITYIFQVTPAVDPTDLTTFTFDDLNLIHSIETSDIAKAGTYSVETRAVTPLDVDTGIGNTFTVTIRDPCTVATLTFDPVIVPSPYKYLLQSAADVQSILSSNVLSSETIVTCPPVELAVVKDDSNPIDAAIFTFDQAASTLTSFSNDQFKVGVYPMKIQAKYSGTQYSIFDYDFSVNVIDPCLNDATISPNAQTSPPDYYYTGSASSADFTLAPFTINPTFCTQTFSCVTLVSSVGQPEICSIPGISSFDAATGSFQFGTTDMVTYPDGVYKIEITSTISSESNVVTFDLTLVDPCPTATISLNSSPFGDETNDLGAAETTQSWDLASLHTIDTLVDCGTYELQFYLNDSSQTLLNTAIFEDRRGGASNNFARKFVTDYAFVGSYEITYSVSLVTYPGVKTEQMAPFTVTINLSCTTPMTFVTSTQVDQEYTLTDLSSDYTFDAFAVDPPVCDIVYNYSISDTAGESVVAFDDALRTFTFDHTANLDPLVDPFSAFKDFTVIVRGTTGDVTPVTVETSFNLKVLNPCFDPAFVWIDTVPLPTSEEYILFDYEPVAPYAFSHTPFQVQTAPFQHSYCGGLTYEATFEGSVIDKTSKPMQFDGASNTFEIYSEDYALLGLRDVTVEASLTNYATITTLAAEVTDILLIDPCIDYLTLTVPPQTPPADYYYSAESPELIFETVQFVTDPPHCAVNTTYSCAIIAGPITADNCNFSVANSVGGSTIGAFDSANGRYTFNSIDIVRIKPGTYTQEVTGTSGSKIESFAVDQVLVDPCFTVDLQLQPSPFVDAIYVLYEPGMEQAWQAENLISPLTQVDCGPITVQFFDGDFNPINTALFQDDQSTAPSNFLRTIMNTDESTDGPYLFHYRVYHEGYPANTVTSLFPFTITIIRSCANPKTLFPSVLEDQEYTVTDVPKPYTVPAFAYTPTFCDLVYSFTVDDPQGQLAFTFNAGQKVRKFTFFNDNDLSLAGPTQTTYTITVRALLGTQATLEVTSSFQLTLKNPCIDPAFVTIDKVALPTGLEYDLYAFDLILGYTFQHDPFDVTTNPLLAHSLCGEVHYNVWFEGDVITEVTRPMKYDTLTRTFDMYSEDLNLVGLRTFEVQAFLKDYPVTSFAPNLVETIQIFDPCDRPYSMMDPGQNQSLEYSYTPDGLTYILEPFVVDPPVCDVTYECISDSCLTKAVRFQNERLDFETFDMVQYPPGEIEFTISTTVGNLIPLTELTTIKITLINPCSTVGTSFQNQFPIEDVRYVLGRPQIAQPYDELFQLDTRVDCGTINFEFVDEYGSPIKTTLFSAPETDADERVFKVLQQKATSSVGEYKIKYRATLELYPQAVPIVLGRPFTVVIEKPPSPSVYIFNVVPDWISTLEDQYVTQGEQLMYFFDKNENFFGEETNVTVRMREANLFSRYDQLKHAFVVDGTMIPDSMVGLHKIRVQASYVDPKGQSQVFNKSFYLHVKEIPKGAEKTNVTESQTTETINVSDWTGFTMMEPQADNKNRPIPYITDFSQTGVMTIGWDRIMTPYEKPQEIPPNRIAVQATILDQDSSAQSAAGRRRRQLSEDDSEGSQREIREEIWYKNMIEQQEGEKYNRMLLLDALQVRIEKDADTGELSEAAAKNFIWDVIDFDKDFIRLQINFENPSDIDTLDSKDYITVTFWGIEFFKSFQGVEIEFGTQLKWQILRQLKVEEAEQIDSLLSFLSTVMILGLLPMLLILGLGGRLLPTWMFINSLQLVAHVPMLDAHVPANLHYFLVDFLSLIRLQSKKISDSVEAWQKERGMENYMLISDEEASYSGLLNLCGYKHAFSRNLIVVIFFAMTLLLVIAALFIWKLVQARRQKVIKKSYHGAWALNFSLRFAYEFFLEICISAAINLAAYKVNANESGLLWAIALFLSLSVLALIGFFISLFCRGGPYTVPNSYQQGSMKSSIWGKRALCQTNCSKLCSSNAQDQCQNPPGNDLKISSVFVEGAVDEKKNLQNDEQLETARPLIQDEQAQVVPNSGASSQDTIQFDMNQAFVKSLNQIADSSSSSDSQHQQQNSSHSEQSSSRDDHLSDSSRSSGGGESQKSSRRDHCIIHDNGFCQTPNSKLSQSSQHESVKRERYEGGEAIQIKLRKKSRLQEQQGQLTQLKSQNYWEEQERIKEEAQMRVRLQSMIEPKMAYKTLFYGLKSNQPHNMAIVHPLAFVLRRILYAFVILFLVGSAAFFGVLLLLLTCLMFITFIVVEAQWQDSLINRQHMINEVFFYLLCVSLLLFSGVLDNQAQVNALGWLMILVATTMIIYNVIVILSDTLCYVRLLYTRYRLTFQQSPFGKKLKNMDLCKRLQNWSCGRSEHKKSKKKDKKMKTPTAEAINDEKVKENQVVDEEYAMRMSVGSKSSSSHQNNSSSSNSSSYASNVIVLSVSNSNTPSDSLLFADDHHQNNMSELVKRNNCEGSFSTPASKMECPDSGILRKSSKQLDEEILSEKSQLSSRDSLDLFEHSGSKLEQKATACLVPITLDMMMEGSRKEPPHQQSEKSIASKIGSSERENDLSNLQIKLSNTCAIPIAVEKDEDHFEREFSNPNLQDSAVESYAQPRVAIWKQNLKTSRNSVVLQRPTETLSIVQNLAAEKSSRGPFMTKSKGGNLFASRANSVPAQEILGVASKRQSGLFSGVTTPPRVRGILKNDSKSRFGLSETTGQNKLFISQTEHKRQPRGYIPDQQNGSYNFWERKSAGSNNGDDEKFSQSYSMSIHEKAQKKKLSSRNGSLGRQSGRGELRSISSFESSFAMAALNVIGNQAVGAPKDDRYFINNAIINLENRKKK